MIDIEKIRDYCLLKAGSSESFPFDEHTLVFKTGGKIFALLALNDQPLRINLKSDPQEAIELREEFDWIIPGYHMNKKHWNTIILDVNAIEHLTYALIDKSYSLVFKSLPKKMKSEILEK